MPKRPREAATESQDGKRCKATHELSEAHYRKRQTNSWSSRSSFTHKEMDGRQIPPEFALLENEIMVAADSLSGGLEAGTSFRLNLDEYALENVEYLQKIPIDNILQSGPRNACYEIARIFIGWFLYRWGFRAPFLGYESYEQLIKEAIGYFCNTKSKCIAFQL